MTSPLLLRWLCKQKAIERKRTFATAAFSYQFCCKNKLIMGGDHHDHHHKPKITIPDYKQYKIDGIPQLEAIQKHLASKGLRDPWLRNEAWRYDPKIWGSDSVARHACRLLFRGFKLGFAAFVVTTSATVAYDKFIAGEDPHHGHGHH